MRNVIARAALLAVLATTAVLAAGCCKCNPPPATSATAVVPAAATATEPVSGTVTEGNRTPPETKEACKACNGDWGQHGMAKTEGCLCRTKDGGKACRDGAECQGQCVAEDKDFVVVEKGPPVRGHYKGKCSEFDVTFGCHRFLPRGAGTRGPLAKDDAAEQLCYD